ncbi:hypothetical protein [Escherichia coli]|uniref:hypothetical protein n=1 Tax=Escherichia coli TaxID=562 RepID=UPI003EBD3C29
MKIFFGGKGYFSLPEANKFNKKTLFGSVKPKIKTFILTFFAGSGTTAHGILELNIEDGRKRNFICVQLDEETDKKKQAYKEGYKSIFNITKDRIIKAGKKS